MSQPVVSIVIPLYNRATLIAETLNSVLSQTYERWLCVVVDDGSTDNSFEVAAKYANRDSRIKLHQRERPPKGAPTCRNIGVEKYETDFVLFLDADDLLAPWCLEQRISTAFKNPGFDFYIFQAMLFEKKMGDRNTVWNILKSRPSLHRFLLSDVPWGGTGTLWKRNSFVSIGGWSEGISDWQDPDLHLRAILTPLKFYEESLNLLPDHFGRISPIGSVAQISHQEQNPERILQRCMLFKKWVIMFRKSYLADDEKQLLLDYLSGYFFRYAQVLFFMGNVKYKELLKEIGILHRQGNVLYYVALLYLFYQKYPGRILGFRSFGYRYLRKLLPWYYTNPKSTHRRVPLNNDIYKEIHLKLEIYRSKHATG